MPRVALGPMTPADALSILGASGESHAVRRAVAYDLAMFEDMPDNVGLPGEWIDILNDEDTLRCDLCTTLECAADLTPDWNGETGNHLSCEARRV